MEQSKILTLAEIASVKDIEERVVPVPQWGGSVKIRTFTKRQADRMRQAATRYNPRSRQDEIDQELLVAMMFVEGVIDPVLTLEDYEQLQEKSAVAVAVIQKAILDASGLSDSAVAEAAKSVAAQHDDAIRVPLSQGNGNDQAGTLEPDEHGRIRILDSTLSG